MLFLCELNALSIGRGFAPHNRFVFFFTRRRRRRVSIYQSYYGREETKYSRSEWGRGRALTFKTIGRGFAPRQRFVFFTRSAFAFNRV